MGQGRVTVNGRPARIGDSADPDADTISVDGIPISHQDRVYFALNKPVGYESSLDSTTGKPTVIELIDTDARIFPIGRLDVDSHGLLLLTNDGDFANLVMHPRSSVSKVYRVLINGRIPDSLVDEMRQGIELEEAVTLPCSIDVLERDGNKTMLRMTLHEGRKRQIRRMVAKVGFAVMDLRRDSVGDITLANLKEGEYRCLTPEEVERLRKPAVGGSGALII